MAAVEPKDMMRLTTRLAAALAFTLLAACQMLGPKASAPSDVAPLATDAIAVTPLDGAPVVTTPLAGAAAAKTAAEVPPPVQNADKTTPHPEPRPDAAAALAATTAAAEVAPPAPPPVSPQEALCTKKGGDWSAMGKTSGRLCVYRTRDPGKSCTKKTDCQGECLAQSGTCSPITPLTGCNDILQANGSKMTLCLQ